jgi:hypothetical protein
VIVECQHCGAPLDVQASSSFTRCSYCDRVNNVKSTKTLMAESPAGWSPPVVWSPPPQYRLPAAPLPYRPKPAKKVSCLGLMVGFGIPVTVVMLTLWGSGLTTNLPFVGLDTSGAPSLGTVDVASSPGPTLLPGTASGGQSADTLGSHCRGYLERSPHVLLRVARSTAVQLDVEASGVDLVMAVRTAAGEWLCDDDSGGSLAPRISTTLPPGEHRVWVGTYSSSGSAPFLLRVQAQGAQGVPPGPPALAVDAAPSLAAVTLGVDPLEESWTGTTSSWVDASHLDSRCRGHVPAAPHLTLTTSEPRSITLATRENQSTDLVMLARSPSGVLACDDDSGGSLNPQLALTLEPGTTAVWVGVYSEGQYGSFALDARDANSGGAAAPRLRSGAATGPLLGTVDLDTPGRGTNFAGRVRTEQPIRDIGARCDGFIAGSPTMVLRTTQPRALALRASGARGLRLVLEDSSGQFLCSEARSRSEVSLTDSLGPGEHRLWVGTSDRRTADFRLRVE